MGSNKDEVSTAYSIRATWTGHGCGERSYNTSHNKTHKQNAARLKNALLVLLSTPGEALSAEQLQAVLENLFAFSSFLCITLLTSDSGLKS